MIIKPVNTNVITGFLGVGKTSLIKQLLKHKPENEVWAVLVNEFGEIGIDAGLINTSPAEGGNKRSCWWLFMLRRRYTDTSGNKSNYSTGKA